MRRALVALAEASSARESERMLKPLPRPGASGAPPRALPRRHPVPEPLRFSAHTARVSESGAAMAGRGRLRAGGAVSTIVSESSELPACGVPTPL